MGRPVWLLQIVVLIGEGPGAGDHYAKNMRETILEGVRTESGGCSDDERGGDAAHGSEGDVRH